ncbi:hypothetical protein BY996DRAFT_4589567 [Phakopsora pachyrhizi]|nr:hypothetical protein BY996DRAFT_4600065 [Phakopsora pachyrhizi]KAI8449231.1 hypothetical protein BY996DRAFT_4589567 [Phakopsora pachyrhizi]
MFSVILIVSWLLFASIGTSLSLVDEQQRKSLRDLKSTSKTQASGSEQTYDTSNLIFASFLGLLQQWPNSFAYSGHSIITGTIPPSTPLYHSLEPEAEPPQGMEWLAFDPEQSYQYHSLRGGKTKLLTYVSERPLRIIYIDGQSASLGTPGFMDSQAVLIDGKVEEEWGEGDQLDGEYKRARNLCAIGEEWGFEGVVRMNTGFELIWCDFKKGLKLIGKLNFTKKKLNSAQPTYGPSSVLSNRPSHPFYYSSTWMWLQSASWHNDAPGEARVKLDPSGFVSFYDRINSLNKKRRADGTENSDRSNHRLYGVSNGDVVEIRKRLIRALKRKNEGRITDQVDWTTIALTISQRYGSRLEELSEVLKDNTKNATMTALQVRRVTYEMMMPYVDFSEYDSKDFRWLEPSIAECTTAYTFVQLVNDGDSTESIRTIKKSIEGTLRRICETVTEMFSETLAMELPVAEVQHNPKVERIAQAKVSGWKSRTDQLIKWLGWSWKSCDSSWLADDICLPPAWPLVNTRLNSTKISQFPVLSYLNPNMRNNLKLPSLSCRSVEKLSDFDLTMIQAPCF